MKLNSRHLRMLSPARMKGVTLLELMIVVVIIGILATVAFPSYQQQVLKTRRADGKSALLDAGQELERCYTLTNTYLGCVPPSGAFPIASPDNYYVVAVARTASAFTLSATPQGAQTGDTQCGVLQIDNIGGEGSQAAIPDANGCW